MSGVLFSASICPVALKGTHHPPYRGPRRVFSTTHRFLLACLSGNCFGGLDIFPQKSLNLQVNNEWREVRFWGVGVDMGVALTLLGELSCLSFSLKASGWNFSEGRRWLSAGKVPSRPAQGPKFDSQNPFLKEKNVSSRRQKTGGEIMEAHWLASVAYLS